jgi:hypothetical protein
MSPGNYDLWFIKYACVLSIEDQEAEKEIKLKMKQNTLSFCPEDNSFPFKFGSKQRQLKYFNYKRFIYFLLGNIIYTPKFPQPFLNRLKIPQLLV